MLLRVLVKLLVQFKRLQLLSEDQVSLLAHLAHQFLSLLSRDFLNLKVDTDCSVPDPSNE